MGQILRDITLAGDGGTTNTLAYDKNDDKLIVTGTTVPTATTTGYAKGCLFFKTNAADGTRAVYENIGTNTSCNFNVIGDVTAAEIGANAITPIKMGTRTLVALTDAAATPTIAQLMTSSVFTITPTAARTFTTPTAALMVAGITGATVGSWFDFTIVNLGNLAVTLTAGDAGVTLTGNAVINKGSATFRAVLTNVTASSEALTIYRTDGALVAENIPLANTKILIGDANGLAAAQTMGTDATIAASGALTIAAGVVTRAKQTAAAASKTLPLNPATIATTGNADAYLIVPETGTLASVDFSGTDALAAHDTNYITFSITNLGQAGAGSTAMLAATDANTTKATGGTALVANGKRTLTLNGTPANLDVTAGDRLLVRAAASGTLANTVTFPAYLLRFAGTT